MKRIVILLSVLFLLVGCNNKLQDTVNERVYNDTYNENYEYLSNLINELKMFPTRELEEEYIYFVYAIKANVKSYNKDELHNLIELMSFDYKFGLNKLKYTPNEYQNDLQVIKDYYEEMA